MTRRKSRRVRGDGTTYQRKDGRWSGEITLPDGKRRQVYGRSEAEIKTKLKKLVDDFEETKRPKDGPETLGAYLQEWLEDTVSEGTRERTFIRYEEICRLHIVPTLGHLPLRDLARHHLQTLYRNKRKEGLSKQTVKHIHDVLRNALNVAVDSKYLDENVVLVAKPPRLPKVKKKKGIPIETAIRILTLVQQERWLDCPVTLALQFGIREGELLALRWANVDFEVGIIRVEEQVQRIKKKGLKVVDTKPLTECHEVPLTELAKKALARQKARIDAMRIAAGDKWVERDLVMPNTIGKPMEARNLIRRFDAFLAKHQLPDMVFHHLRHSTGGLLTRLGVPIQTVSQILGHADISITARFYLGKDQTAAKAALDKLSTELDKTA